MQRKVDPRNKHEQHGDRVNQGTVEIPHVRVVSGKSADGHRAEAMAKRIEEGHAGRPVRQQARDGDACVDIPERLGRLRDFRRQLRVLDRTRRFGSIELHAADAEHRQNGDGKHDDPHSAEPLQLLTVIEDCRRQVIETAQHRRTGSRQAGNRLEDGIGQCDMRYFREIERRGPENAQHHPERSDDHEPVAKPEILLAVTYRQPEQETDDSDDEERLDELHGGTVVKVHREDDRRQHAEAEDCQQQPEHALDG